MWVFCCGMPRSGSTLQFQITAKLIEKCGLGKRVEWTNPKEFFKLKTKYENYKKIKVFKTHFATEDIINEFKKKNALGVYIYRDIRDVVVSHMRKYSMDFPALLKTNFIENRIKNHNKWQALENILVSKYETVMADIAEEVERIANHLNMSLSDKEYTEIAIDFKLSNQIKRIEKYKSSLSYDELRKGGVIYDPYNQLHINHIHSGEVGGWNDFLKKDEVIEIEKRAGKWLVSNGYLLSE